MNVKATHVKSPILIHIETEGIMNMDVYPNTEWMREVKALEIRRDYYRRMIAMDRIFLEGEELLPRKRRWKLFAEIRRLQGALLFQSRLGLRAR